MEGVAATVEIRVGQLGEERQADFCHCWMHFLVDPKGRMEKLCSIYQLHLIPCHLITLS